MLHPGRFRRFFRTALAAVFLLSLLGADAVAQPLGGWDPFGPGGGTVTSVAVDPTDSAVVYAAATDAVSKSTDGGVTWQARLGPIHSLVAVDPSHPAIVYAGGTSIARSRDGGQTWRTVLADDRLVNGLASLAVAPSAPATLYAMANNGHFTEIFRSDDAAQSWRELGATPPITEQALVVDPRSASRLYAAGQDGIFASSDGGESWGRLQAGLPTLGLLFSRDGGRTLNLDPAPLEVGETAITRLWTDRNHPRRIWAGGAFGGLYVGRFE